jgi:iron complex transport system ATP-binding protein
VVSVLHEIGVALHADQMLIVDQGRVRHQGACDDPATHRALEAVFQQRIAIHPLGDDWVALPRSATAPPG